MKNLQKSSTALSNLSNQLETSSTPQTESLRKQPTSIQSPNFNLEQENLMLRR